MKKIYLVIMLCMLSHVLYAQAVSSRICVSCNDEGGGGAAVNCPVTQTILYVDASRASSGNGTTWQTAKKTLQEALNIANQCNKVYAIHMAEGVYKPSATDNRDHNFFIGNSFVIYGGYPQGGGLRDPAVYSTILDGDIGNEGIQTDNSYHVVLVAGINGDVTLDGIQIRNGRANGAGFVNLYDDDNLDRSDAAGLYVYDVSGTVTIRNCVFSNNSSNRYGGGIYARDASLEIIQCIFYGSTAVYGDAVYSSFASMMLTHCTLYNPGSDGIYGTGSVKCSNSIIWGNDEIFGGSATYTTLSCVVQAAAWGNGTTNADPQWANVQDGDGADNKWFTQDDGLRLKWCSPAINKGSNNLADGIDNDITGNPRIYDEQVDAGAYEYRLPILPPSAFFLAPGESQTAGYLYAGTTALTDNCQVVISIRPNGSEPYPDWLYAKVFVETQVPTLNGKPYVARHYQMSSRTPGAGGRLTLYFTQQDFDDYNTAVGTKKDHLPGGPDDATNISKLRINQLGVDDGNPQPLSVSNIPSFIDPDDEDIEWHPARNFDPGYWSVTFNVTDFGRFLITAGANSALPVEWLGFTGNLLNHTVKLAWQTASEKNSSHFIIQRSVNAFDFENIGRVNAAGTTGTRSSYTWLDDISSTRYTTSTLYYLLQQVDTDGRYTFSKIIQVKMDARQNWLLSVINPVKHNITATIDAGIPGNVLVTIIDMQGRLLLRDNRFLDKGINTLYIPVAHLGPGIYMAAFELDGKRITRKLVKIP